MPRYRIQISHKGKFPSPEERRLRAFIKELNLPEPEDIRTARLYFIEADLDSREIEEFCSSVLADPVCEEFIIRDAEDAVESVLPLWIEIGFLPGVMDSQAITVARAIRESFRIEPGQVHTGVRYEFSWQDRSLAERLLGMLFNPLIETGRVNETINPFTARMQAYEFKLIEVELLSLDDSGLERLSRDMLLSLNVEEMRFIQDYYRRLGRNPTDVELETIAQTWSEHCQHKTFKSPILYREVDESGATLSEERIGSLFKDYIMKSTSQLGRKWCLSVFKDNAGVVNFDDKYAVCFKVETHNHPSALEPFGGANTGVGGVIRDILGCGLGAKPIANTDVFCFAPPDESDVPEGVLPPKRIMMGVVAGVRDYGNKMGIPTVNGAVFFDKEFIANPLVYCGTVGVMPKTAIEKKVEPGDKIVVIGGRTGRDGIHGATFSSAELDSETQASCSSAVQIGNPIEEKKFADVLLRIRDNGWYRAVTDCGAGGLSSAVGEMAEHTGAVVYLDRVPLKYVGLSYSEIWISESQERMVLAVKPEHLDELISAFEEEDVEAVCIGEFTGDGKLRLFYGANQVMDMDVSFLHGKVPLREKTAVWVKREGEETLPCVKDAPKLFKSILSSYNIASKEWVIRQYDHEVQGRSVLKPLAGKKRIGPMDAAVLRVHLHGKKAIAISNGINPLYGKIDPYWMAGAVIDEAVRQIIAVGGRLDRIALLDNFCWGSPDKPDRLAGLVRAAKGCYEFSVGLGLPFISGKDSLYNEYIIDGQSRAIPGTLLISAIGIIDDAGKVVSSDFKTNDSLLYIVGVTRDELGGSAFLQQFGLVGTSVPRLDINQAKAIYEAMEIATKEGLLLSCHDISDGGLGIAVAEMCIGSGIGAEIFLNNVPFEGIRRTDEALLYSESLSRFVVEIDKKHKGRFEKIFSGLPAEMIGRTKKQKTMDIYGLEGDEYISVDIKLLTKLWRSRFNWQ